MIKLRYDKTRNKQEIEREIFMKKYKSQRGITLIALVITIIILLILAGISIAALTNQGLFKNAKEAQNATQKAEEEQGKTLNEYEDEINKYLENDKKIDGKIVDRVNDGTIKIGDYVDLGYKGFLYPFQLILSSLVKTKEIANLCASKVRKQFNL